MVLLMSCMGSLYLHAEAYLLVKFKHLGRIVQIQTIPMFWAPGTKSSTEHE